MVRTREVPAPRGERLSAAVAAAVPAAAAAPAAPRAPPPTSAAAPPASAAPEPALPPPVRVERLAPDGLAVLTLDVGGPAEKVNVLTPAALEGFERALALLEASPPPGLVILSAKRAGFVAGVDIKLFEAAATPAAMARLSSEGNRLFSRLERFAARTPTVAGLHGATLGGGLELALACSYRVATPDAVCALPEVKLGLLPAAGGTVRLPRLLGAAAALELMTTGRALRGPRALAAGLVDELVDARALRARAVAAARALAAGTLSRAPRARSLLERALEGTALGRALLFARAEAALAAAPGAAHYPAPLAIVRAVRAGLEGGAAAGAAAEAAAFGALGPTPASAALRGLFFAETAAKKAPFAAAAAPVATLGVVGAGLMGAGVAAAAADAGGLAVVLRDVSPAAVARGRAAVAAALEAKVKAGRLTRVAAAAAAARVLGVAGEDDGGAAWRRALGRCELVLEAVPERLALKHAVLAELEPAMREGAVFATNTSALSVAAVAAGAATPASAARVVGMHFFSPADRMPLVEIVPWAAAGGLGTSPAAAATAFRLARALGKTAVVVKDVPGFYVNRALTPMLCELVALVQAGVPPRAIDAAVGAFGMPVGACALADEVGLDVAAHVIDAVAPDIGARALGPNLAGLHAAVAAGFLGRKSGSGFFVYPPPPPGGARGARGPPAPRAECPRMLALQRAYAPPSAVGYHAAAAAALAAPGGAPALADRLILRFVAEAVRALEDGVIASAAVGDLAAVYGLGFPPWRGGPFRYVDARGPAAVVKAMDALAAAVGPQFEAPKTLRKLADEGGTFHARVA